MSDGGAEVVPTLDRAHAVAQTLGVVARLHLRVHVVEHLAASVLRDQATVAVEREHQVPVPVMQVDADILAEVPQTLLRVQVRRRVIRRDDDRRAGALRQDVDVLTRLSNDFRVHKFVGESLDEGWNLHAFRVLAVECRDGQRVVEQLGIDPIADISGDAR